MRTTYSMKTNYNQLSQIESVLSFLDTIDYLDMVQHYSSLFALKLVFSFIYKLLLENLGFRFSYLTWPLFLLPHNLDYMLEYANCFLTFCICFVYMFSSQSVVHSHNSWCIHSIVPILTIVPSTFLHNSTSLSCPDNVLNFQRIQSYFDHCKYILHQK